MLVSSEFWLPGAKVKPEAFTAFAPEISHICTRLPSVVISNSESSGSPTPYKLPFPELKAIPSGSLKPKLSVSKLVTTSSTPSKIPFVPGSMR